MKWVTWERVGIDRMGCAWLIRKHIDPKAKFLFVPVGCSPPGCRSTAMNPWPRCQWMTRQVQRPSLAWASG